MSYSFREQSHLDVKRRRCIFVCEKQMAFFPRGTRFKHVYVHGRTWYWADFSICRGFRRIIVMFSIASCSYYARWCWLNMYNIWVRRMMMRGWRRGVGWGSHLCDDFSMSFRINLPTWLTRSVTFCRFWIEIVARGAKNSVIEIWTQRRVVFGFRNNTLKVKLSTSSKTKYLRT